MTRAGKTQLELDNLLLLGCQEGRLDIVREALAAGADVNSAQTKKRFSETPLHYVLVQASGAGRSIDVLSALIEAGADLQRKNTDGGDSALHLAASDGWVEAVRVLLDGGAEIEARNDSGWTPLHWACFTCADDAAKLLIERGADVNAKSIAGQTPLEMDGAQGVSDWYHGRIAQGLIENSFADGSGAGVAKKPRLGLSI